MRGRHRRLRDGAFGLEGPGRPLAFVEHGDQLVAGTDALDTAISTDPATGVTIRSDETTLCIKPVDVFG